MAAMAQHLAAHRLAGEQRLGEERVHQIVGGVLVHPDLVEDDLPFAVDLIGPEGRGPHDVGEDVEGEVEALVEDPDVVGGVLLRGEGVHLPTDRLHRFGDLLGAAGLGALEQQVLEEVAGAGQRVGLVARARPRPEAHRHRPQLRHGLGDDAQAVRQARPSDAPAVSL
jgi:hypothetical protein